MNKKVLIIVGPTASSKTETAVLLASKINGEIISADSRQVYKEISIGTAKPEDKNSTKIENGILYKGIPYYLVNFISLTDDFSAGDYKILCEKLIFEILNKNKVPIIVGGTGLYIKAVVDGIAEIPKINKEIREELNLIIKQKGIEFAYKELQKVDPEICKNIDKSNPRRIARALEVFKGTNVPLSVWQKKSKKSDFDFEIFGINWDREKLYEKINKRVDLMIAHGLLDEIRSLLDKDFSIELINKAGIGYNHLAKYLKNELDFNREVELVKQDTRKYAKRQMTWFRKDQNIKWLNVDEKTKIDELILNFGFQI